MENCELLLSCCLLTRDLVPRVTPRALSLLCAPCVAEQAGSLAGPMGSRVQCAPGAPHPGAFSALGPGCAVTFQSLSEISVFYSLRR